VSAALLAALASAVFYGVAAVLQALGARSSPSPAAVDPRGLTTVLRQLPFLIGLALDGFGFVGQFFALRDEPVFVVQAAQAGSLAVTAVVAVPVLGLHLRKRHWIAVATVCTGLVLLALSAGDESATRVSILLRTCLLVAAVALAGLGFAANRLSPARRAPAMGTVAGLGFGVVALAARSLTGLTPASLVRDPATYALILGGLAGFLFFTMGLQRGSVTAVTAAVVVGETALPALIGVLILGDRTRPGLVPLAVFGFLAAVAGALILAGFDASKPAERREESAGAARP
jgi:drug/metabolite transporter (DMT)-like permease